MKKGQQFTSIDQVKIGMKVVPHSKSIWGPNLSDSSCWETAKDKNQPFLYVVEIEEEGPNSLTLSYRKDGGDYFLLSDITFYDDVKKDAYICIKSYPGVSKGTIFSAPFIDESIFRNTEFFEPITKPSLKIEDYDVSFDKETKQVCWGCRKFTVKEFTHIVETFRIMYDNDLNLGVARTIYDFTYVKYKDLKTILDWVNSQN